MKSYGDRHVGSGPAVYARDALLVIRPLDASNPETAVLDFITGKATSWDWAATGGVDVLLPVSPARSQQRRPYRRLAGWRVPLGEHRNPGRHRLGGKQQRQRGSGLSLVLVHSMRRVSSSLNL